MVPLLMGYDRVGYPDNFLNKKEQFILFVRKARFWVFKLVPNQVPPSQTSLPNNGKWLLNN